MNDIVSHGYSSFYTTVIIMVILLAIGTIVAYYLVKRKVAKSMQRAMNANNIMQQAIALSDRIIVGYKLEEKQFYNIHGDLLPKDDMTVKDIMNFIHPNNRDAFKQHFKELLSGTIEEAKTENMLNVNYGKGKPVWHHVQTHGITEYENGRRTHIIFCVTDKTNEQRIRKMDSEMSEKYKLIFENSIIGMSFYSPDGYLIDANRQMREICNFNGRYDSKYFNTSILESLHFPDKKHDSVEEYWGCQRMIDNERGVDKYVESRIHPVYDANGHMKFFVISARDITQERELYMQNKLNNEQISYANKEITRYEEQLRYLLEHSKMHVWNSSFEQREITFYKDLHESVLTISFEDFEKILQEDEDNVIKKMIMEPCDETGDTHEIITRPLNDLFKQDGKTHWFSINSLPKYDKQGRQIGKFGLIRDTTTLIEEQEMLKQETERANDSGRQKSIFLANMTHEIRTPLNAIVGFSDLLQAIESPEEKREMMRIIRNNCDMLLRLVNDVLAVSTIDNNGMLMNAAELDFAKAFDDACQSLAQRITNPDVEFIIDNPYETLRTSLDKERIVQVITNFVTNAVKYTTQGHIKIGYQVTESESDNPPTLRIYCEDTGAGIPKEDSKRIFERFVKLNDYIQGTGLGLSICKAIANSCKGDIGVDSEVGKGSTFWFWMPCELLEVKEKTNN